MYTRWEHTNLKLEAVSDLAGDTMMLSESESPTDSPFRLDAIICKYWQIKEQSTGKWKINQNIGTNSLENSDFFWSNSDLERRKDGHRATNTSWFEENKISIQSRLGATKPPTVPKESGREAAPILQSRRWRTKWHSTIKANARF